MLPVVAAPGSEISTDDIRLPNAESGHAAVVTVVDTAQDFTALRAEWNSLLRSSASDSPFLTWEWLHTWWMHVGRTSALRIGAVRLEGELIAVAPFFTSSETSLPALQMLATGEAGSDYLDVIVRRGCEADALPALDQFFCLQNRTVHLRHLSSWASASDVADRLAAHGWHATTRPGGICPYISLGGHTWDSYLATLGSSHRANVRRRIRGLEQKFQMSFDRVTTQAQRREALEAMYPWHEKRFSERGTAFMSDALRAFHDEVTSRTLDLGWLRMFVLHLDGAPVAVMYGFLYGDRFYFFQHGFDDAYQQHSVGLVLMALSIRTAIEEGAAEFDMLWGTESYKSLWASNTRHLRNIDLFPPTVGGLIHRGVLHARRRAGAIVRRARESRSGHGS